MNTIADYLEKFLKTLLTFSEQNNNKLLVTEITALLTKVVDILRSDKLSLIALAIDYAKNKKGDQSRFAALTHDLLPLYKKFIKSLFSALINVNAESTIATDQFLAIIDIISKALKHFIVYLTLNPPMLLKPVIQETLTSLKKIEYFFKTLHLLRKHNIESKDVIQLDKSLSNLIKLYRQHDSLDQIDRSCLSTLVKTITSSLYNIEITSNLYYFHLTPSQWRAFLSIMTVDNIIADNLKSGLSIVELCVPQDEWVKINKCLENIKQISANQLTDLTATLADKSKHEIKVSETVKKLESNLEKGIQNIWRSNSPFKDEMKEKLLQLRDAASDLQGLLAYFDLVRVLPMGLDDQTYLKSFKYQCLDARSHNLQEHLIETYEDAVYKKHKILEMFEYAYGRNNKNAVSKTIQEIIIDKIRTTFAADSQSPHIEKMSITIR